MSSLPAASPHLCSSLNEAVQQVAVPNNEELGLTNQGENLSMSSLPAASVTQKKKRGRPPKKGNQSSSLNEVVQHDAILNNEELGLNNPDENLRMSSLLAASAKPKRKRGRPSKKGNQSSSLNEVVQQGAVPNNEELCLTNPDEKPRMSSLPATSVAPKRKRGRPSKKGNQSSSLNEVMQQGAVPNNDELGLINQGENLRMSSLPAASVAPKRKRGRPPKKGNQSSSMNEVMQQGAVPNNEELGLGGSQQNTIQASSSEPVVIGIHFGATHSQVGVYRNGNIEIISDFESIPSYPVEGEGLVGEIGKEQPTSNTVFWGKRLIGRDWEDPVVQSAMESKFFPFKLIKKDSNPHFELSIINGDQRKTKIFSPDAIASMVFLKLKKTAEAHLGKKVTYAVVTVPASFNQVQRQSTKEAAHTAGFEVVRLLNEPTAAAMAYAYFNMNKKENKRKVLVFHLGSGSLDVSVITIQFDTPRTRNFKVLAINGDANLGVDNFKQNVVEYFIKEFEDKTGKNASGDKRALFKMNVEVEKAINTIGSSYNMQANIFIEDFLGEGDFNEILTRTKFEELNSDLLRDILKPIQMVLEEAHMEKKELNEILLIGGGGGLSKISELLKSYFKGEIPFGMINPEQVIVQGAVVQAGSLACDKDLGKVHLIERSRYTLGIPYNDGGMEKMIPRNTDIRMEGSITFPLRENSNSITFEFFEGEREMVVDNRLVGELRIEMTPELKKTPAEMNVEFEITLSGILFVWAKHDRKIRMTNPHQNILTKNGGRSTLQNLAAIEKKGMEWSDAKKKFKAFVILRRKLFRDKDEKGELRASLTEDEVDKFGKAVDESIKWLASSEADQADDKEFEKRQEELHNVTSPMVNKLWLSRKGEI